MHSNPYKHCYCTIQCVCGAKCVCQMNCCSGRELQPQSSALLRFQLKINLDQRYCATTTAPGTIYHQPHIVGCCFLLSQLHCSLSSHHTTISSRWQHKVTMKGEGLATTLLLCCLLHAVHCCMLRIFSCRKSNKGDLNLYLILIKSQQWVGKNSQTYCTWTMITRILF